MQNHCLVFEVVSIGSLRYAIRRETREEESKRLLKRFENDQQQHGVQTAVTLSENTESSVAYDYLSGMERHVFAIIGPESVHKKQAFRWVFIHMQLHFDQVQEIEFEENVGHSAEYPGRPEDEECCGERSFAAVVGSAR